MTHTYIDPRHSVFRFGLLEADVEFAGDLDDAAHADIQDWSFILCHPVHGVIDITPSMEALDSAMTDSGLPGVFRAHHCPRAARELRPG